MQKLLRILSILAGLTMLSACDQAATLQGELNLPEGDAVRGQQHFVSLGCNSCHTVRSVELPAPEVDGPVHIILGSETGRISSYGALVTSIANPSHRIAGQHQRSGMSPDGESIMTVFNDVMTVTQLTDLVAFLQPHYQKVSRPRYRYRTYKYGSDDQQNDTE